MVDNAERVVRSFGVRQLRVRHHVDITGAEIARIEIDPEEMSRVLDPEIMRSLARQFREIGYRHATLDLLGYRRGSANEALADNLIPLTAIT
jgi:uncharacterized protein